MFCANILFLNDNDIQNEAINIFCNSATEIHLLMIVVELDYSLPFMMITHDHVTYQTSISRDHHLE